MAHGRKLVREWQLVLPLTVFFVAFVFAPLAMLAVISAYTDPTFSTPGATQYVKFLTDPFNLLVLWNTLWLALKTTLLALIVGFPLAYLYTRTPRRLQGLLMLIIVLPLLTSAVVRTFAWVVILGREGIVNSLLAALHWAAAPLGLLYTPGAVALALAQIELPLMVLPLITALTAIDPNLRDASAVLGARQWRTFFQVTLPLSVPGLLAGCLLVFAGAASNFVTQTLVGGGQNIFMPYYIYQQAIQVSNYPFAATIAILLLVTVLAVVLGFNLLGRRARGFIHV
jgi:putative spermidine/putrescine transport system permease protein